MFSSSNFPILNELRPRQFSMSITIIIISSSPTFSNHAHSLSLTKLPVKCTRHRNILSSSRIPLFSIDKQRRTRVCTPSAALFSGPVLAGTRSNDGRRAGMARSFVQINFQRGQGYTRERLRFADRNCRNRDRWIFQRILCSVLAPPRLTAHTFRCQFP